MSRKELYIGMTLGLALASFSFAEENSADFFASATADSVADSSVTAVATAPTSASSSTEDAFTLKLSGSHEADYHVPAYTKDGNDRYNNADGSTNNIKTPAFRNDLGAEIRDGTIKAVSHWGFDVTPTTANAQDPNNSWVGSLAIKPYENYISWNPAGFKFSAGYQIFSWGVADRKNPTDNLNPKDYTVGVNPDKIPVLAWDAVWYPSEKLSMEGIVIPSKSTSQYPQDFATTLKGQLLTGIDSFTVSDPATMAGYPVVSSYTVSDVTCAASGTKPKDFVVGTKINCNTSGLDLSFDYLYDMDQYYTPTITTAATTFPVTYGGATVSSSQYYKVSSIVLERKRIHRIGGDAKTTIGKYGLWLESAYSITENDGNDDYSTRKPKLEYTVGGDVNYGPNDTYYANIQYIGTWIPGFDRSFLSDYSGGIPDSTKVGDKSYMQKYYERAMVNSLGLDTEGLMQGATCNLKWELSDALFTPQVTAVYTMPFLYDDTNETRYGALALNPELDFKPVDSFHIKIGSDLYYAWHKVKGESGVRLDTATNAIGAYTPSNNVYIKIVYKWNDEFKK
jgi:hypothetical protein